MDSIASNDAVVRWWTAFKNDNDQEARANLVLHYTPLVKYVVGRLRSGMPSHVDQNDLLSDGVMGLMDAIEKFELDRGLQFQTYATQRIRGAVVDGLRSSDWVPRAVREKIRSIDMAQATLERRLGRPATDHEVAAELQLSVDQLRHMYTETSYTQVVSSDALELHEGSQPNSLIADADFGDDLPEGFLDAVRRLPERDQIVVALYYWEHFTLAEIGQVLQVTESRISQLHSRATMTLRRTLAGSDA